MSQGSLILDSQYRREIIAPEGKKVLQLHLPIDEIRLRIDGICKLDGNITAALQDLPDFSLLEERPAGFDENVMFKCAQYAFRKRMGETWSPLYCDRLLDKDAHELLLKNYEYVTEPQSGDVIVYSQFPGITDYSHPGRYLHFGIFDGSTVDSKWAAGNIYRHRIQDLPTFFGKSAIFVRKKTPIIQVPS